MEKWESGKSASTEFISTFEDLHLNRNRDQTPNKTSQYSFPAYSLGVPLKKHKPQRLVSLCLGVIGQHLEDIITDLAEIAVGFPPDIKLTMLAMARRRKLLDDKVLISLADNSWELLDISGSDVTDLGLSEAAKLCTHLKAVDISHCHKVTTTGVSDVLCHCRSLEVLRCGGCPRSNSTARRCINLFTPTLDNLEEESWEELDSLDIGNTASSLRWLVWLDIDEDSKMSLAEECPRIIVNPQPSSIGLRGVKVPREALANSVLDQSLVKDIDPKTWAFSGTFQKSPILVPTVQGVPELHMAEKFRLAFVERDARLAPKRAKNARQNKRRAEREWMMSSNEAKSIAIASQAGRYLHNKR